MRLVVALCVGLVQVTTACAGVNIRYSYVPPFGAQVDVDTTQPGPNFTIDRVIFHNGASRFVTRVQVWTDSPTTEDLGVMSLSSSSSGIFFPVLLRTPGNLPACRNWSGNWDGNIGSFENAGLRIGILGEINGNLVGSVAANQINGFGVRGRVMGNIRSRGQNESGGIGTTLLSLAAVESSATIVSESTGNLEISPIEMISPGVTRDMDGAVGNGLGDVIVDWNISGARWRGNLSVPNGRLIRLDLGPSGSIVARPGGSRPSIVVKNTIDQIQAASIDADIQVTEQGPSAPEPIGYIQRIQALNGSISGSITCRRFSLTTGGPLPNVGGVRATGALSASLTSVIQDSAIQVSEIGPTALVRTGRFSSTLGDIMLLNAMGLKGQIILGQTLPPPQPPPAPPPPPYTWDRPIFVGGQEILHTPEGEYNIPSAQFGGGAVGLAPFRLYRADSVPTATAPGAQLPASTTTLVPRRFVDAVTPVNIRFYGPIRRANAQATSWSDAVAIECIPLQFSTNPCASDVSWQDADALFQVFGPSASQIGIDARSISIGSVNQAPIPPGLYRVRFEDVLCRDLSWPTIPEVVAPPYCSADPDMSKAFYFRVGIDCDNDGIDRDVDTSGDGTCTVTGCGDFNRVNGIEVLDIFDFLNAWFNSCTVLNHHGRPECFYGTDYRHADFNNSGTLEVLDIFDFLNAWFAGSAAC